MAKRKRKKKNKVLSSFGFAFKITFLILLAVVLVGGSIFYFKYGKGILKLQAEAKQLVSESSLDTFRQSQTSTVYAYNGKKLLTLSGEKDLYYLDYNDIPDYVKKAMISIEDKKFTTHHGVDYKAIVRALIAYVENKGAIKQGASTITQQLARNIFLSFEVSWSRKIKEIFISMELERKYSKYQILEFYLNNIYFANGYYGVEAASRGYFNCSVQDLSLGQVVFLCAIPNNPTLYNPVDKKENTIKRKNRILKQMYKDGWITKSEYDKAVDEDITINIKKVSKKNYVTTFVLYSATRALMQASGFKFQNTFETTADEDAYEKKYDEMYNECSKRLYSGGYQIYTSINMKHQKKLQESLDEALKDFTEKNQEGTYKMQGAAVSIDNKTGLVVAVVGGRKQKTTGYTLNRAFQSYRQPGSSIKPLIVYTPAFENGYTPDSVMNDHRFDGGPRNADGSYAGNITLRRAVAKSKNTIAWQLFEKLTPTIGLSYIKNMNFQRIVSRDYNLASSLGGLTHGVSPIEMASGFATIANEGVYREPSCIVKITDSEGKEIVSEEREGKIIYTKTAARMMVSCMQSVMSEGTGTSVRLPDMSCAGKTGTTNDKKDGWFCGFTPYYTTSVWIGCDTPVSISGLTGSSYPGSVWKSYMSWANEGLDDIGLNAYKEEPSSKKLTVEEKNKREKEEEEKPEENDKGEEDKVQIKPEETKDSNKKPTAKPSSSPSPTPSKDVIVKPSQKPDVENENEEPEGDESEIDQPGEEPVTEPDNGEGPEEQGEGEE